MRLSVKSFIVAAVMGLLTLGPVLTASAGFFDAKSSGPNIERDPGSYQEEGKKWGEELMEEGVNASSGINNSTSQELIEKLTEPDEIDYFGVHSELKEAFKRGFREGYQDRTADLVLAPHLQAAAALMGDNTAKAFVKVINDFEEGWARTLNKAINIFITLIAEGSTKDREEFIKNFIDIYRAKYELNQKVIMDGTAMPFVSQGGTQLYIHPGNVNSTLDIPSDGALKNEIYTQAFRVMGDEMGKRYSNNLIQRGELVEWLRRSKAALNMDLATMDEKLINKNMGIVKKHFSEGYGLDGDNVFDGLVKEAGY